MHQLANLHGLNQYWSSNYSFTWESIKFKQGTLYNLKGLTKYKIEDK